MDKQTEFESFYYVKTAFRILFRYWYVFLLSIVAFMGAAIFANWYIEPMYEVSNIILMAEDPAKATDASKEFMKSFTIFTPPSDIQREVLKMRSSELIYKTLEKIHAETGYYTEQGLKTRELYKNAPFSVEYDRSHVQLTGIRFEIIFKGHDRFTLSIGETDKPIALYNYSEHQAAGMVSPFAFKKDYKFGDSILTEAFSFRIFKEDKALNTFGSDVKFYFVFHDLNALTFEYQKSIEVEQVAKEIEAASIKMKVSNPQKGIDFVNNLTEAYLQRNLDRKNQIAENTIQYFDKQLDVIEDSLKLAEGDLQLFRSSNKIMEINSKADEVFKGAHDLELQKADLEAKIKYYNYLNKALEADNTDRNLIIPSTMGVNDNVLGGVIQEYIQLTSEKNSMVQNKQTHNPYFNSLTAKIESLRKTCTDNAKFQINSSTLLLNNINERLKKENAQISALPNTERELVGKERKYRLNDNIYTYMLEKKAEAQVAKASNLSGNDILEKARLSSLSAVSPNKKLNFIIAFFAGILFPFLGFGLKMALSGVINNGQALKQLTHYPTVGEICQIKEKKNREIPILKDQPRSIVSESLRLVRTNIEHRLQGKRNAVILFTSALSGDGKSFNAYNQAVGFALLEKKTILLDFDLRKPGLHKFFGTTDKTGLTDFLSGKAELSACIHNTEIPSLHFIAAGTISESPAELINSEKTALLLEQLRKIYDYIIIDSPPIGLVSDAQLLVKYADLKVIVARKGHTPKKQLSDVFKELESKEIPHVCWLLNAVEIRDTYYQSNPEYFKK